MFVHLSCPNSPEKHLLPCYAAPNKYEYFQRVHFPLNIFSTISTLSSWLVSSTLLSPLVVGAAAVVTLLLSLLVLSLLLPPLPWLQCCCCCCFLLLLLLLILVLLLAATTLGGPGFRSISFACSRPLGKCGGMANNDQAGKRGEEKKERGGE